MAPKSKDVVVIMIDEESDVEIVAHPSKISKTDKQGTTNTQPLPSPEVTPTTARFCDLTGTFENPSRFISLPSPSTPRKGLKQGTSTMFGNDWSFASLNHTFGSQANTPSSSRSSSTMLDELSPTPTNMGLIAPLVLDLTEDDAIMEAQLPCAPAVDLNFDGEEDEDEETETNIQAALNFSLHLPSVGPLFDLTIQDEISDEEEAASSDQLSSHRRLPTPNDILVDLLALDDLEDTDQADQARAIVESYNPKKSVTVPRRNPAITSPSIILDKVTYKNFTLRPNKTVEYGQGSDLLRIQKIVKNTASGEVYLRGHQLQRNKDMNGILVRKVNEVVLRFEVDLDDARLPEDQAILEVPLEQVRNVRQVRFTNMLIENFRLTRPSELRDMAVALSEGGLTARWKYTTCYRTATDRIRNTDKRGREWTLERVRSPEAPANCSVAEELLRFAWRGETIPGGAYEQRLVSNTTRPRTITRPFGSRNRPIDLESQEHLVPVTERKRRQSSQPSEAKRIRLSLVEDMDDTRRRLSGIQLLAPTHAGLINLADPEVPGEIIQTSLGTRQAQVNTRPRKYTFGDAFCGAGGTTRGAQMAGLKVMWGFDKAPVACRTWEQNFADATCYEMEAFKFNDRCKTLRTMKVDILHMSPPCQFFSPAHTREGPNDEANSASLFAVQELLEGVKPRIVTLEQTFGLLERVNCRQYFNALLHMFTKANFSVRWALIPLQGWGLPARRTRLVMIASCPGEALPRMPPPTHSENGIGGLKPYVSVYQAISRLGPNPNLDRPPKLFTQEQMNDENRKFPTYPYDGNKYLPKAITCRGGGNWHPSGKRDFSLKEYAALQGFPPVHTFAGGDGQILEQIGNAVPPIIAKVLMESIIKDLKAADGILDDGHIVLD